MNEDPHIIGRQEPRVSIMPTLEVPTTFEKILHAPPVDELASMSNVKVMERYDEETALITNGSSCKIFKHGYTTLYIDPYPEFIAPRVSVFMILDMLYIRLAKQNDFNSPQGAKNRTVTISLDEYMTLRGHDKGSRSQRNKDKRTIIEDLNTVYYFSLEYVSPKGGRFPDFKKSRICDNFDHTKSVFSITFTPEFANMLNSAFVADFPTEVFKLDLRNKNAYQLAKKIIIHFTNRNNQKNGTANIISIKKILEACPNITSYEQVAAGDRAFTRRIVEPIENLMDAITGKVIKSWSFCGAGGKQINEEDLASMEKFMQLYVTYEYGSEEQEAQSRELRRQEKQKKLTNKTTRRKKKSTTSERGGSGRKKNDHDDEKEDDEPPLLQLL